MIHEKTRKIPTTVSAMLSLTQKSGPEGLSKCWTLRVEDQGSSTHVLEMELTPDQFSDLLGHRHAPGIKGTVYASENHGRRLETKAMLVPEKCSSVQCRT